MPDRGRRVDHVCWRYSDGVRRRLFFTIVVVALGLGLAEQVAAHSEVFERAPESGQVVGGTVDHIDISFWVPVESGEITLTDPNGEPVDVGATELTANGRITTVDFSALTEQGSYVVTHTELSEDGDTQTAQFAFIYDPSSDARVVPLLERDTGPNWVLLGGLGGVILILAGLFWPGRSSNAS